MNHCLRCGATVSSSARFCGTCGAALPRETDRGARGPQPASLFLAVMAFVVAFIVLASVLYALALNPSSPPTPSEKPTVVLSTPTVSTGAVWITVISVSRAVSVTMFRVGLTVDGVSGVPGELSSGYPFANLTVDGMEYLIYWPDADGTGTVTASDQFIITVVGGAFPSMSTVQFSLLWEDGSPVASVTFQTP